MNTLESNYANIEKRLLHFEHPIYLQKFEFMTNETLINLAEKIVEEINKNKYEYVVISETGASPLIYVCQEIAKIKKYKIEWIYFKTPRSNKIDIYNVLMYYLNEKEREELIELDGKWQKRKEALRSITNQVKLEEYLPNETPNLHNSVKNVSFVNNKIIFSQFRQILKGTYMSNVFNNRFLLFDEYMRLGIILRNFKFYVDLFAEQPNFKLGVYCIFLDNPKDYSEVAFSIYSKKELYNCFSNGVYPFEDRIDLIGYYYYISNDFYSKISLEELIKEFEIETIQGDELDKFVEKINVILNEEKILNFVQSNSKIESIQKYITNQDVLRYLLKILEENYSGNSKYSEFLDQMFELCAPMWLPFPEDLHFDYWETFSNSKERLTQIALNLLQEYLKVRDVIFYKLIKLCLDKKKQWIQQINKYIK